MIFALMRFALALLPLAAASPLETNLAYRSPSLTVKALQIDVHSLYKRDARLSKRDEFWTGNVSFPIGVASGDPYEDSVILWTKVQKEDLVEGTMGGTSYPPVCLNWRVYTSQNATRDSVVTSGNVTTTVDVDWTAKVEATGLKSFTKYYYDFHSCAGDDLGASLIGSFKTLPAEDVLPDQIRLAVFSCSNYPFGFFNAYGGAANNTDEIDYVQHVGDYIYEYMNGAYGDGTPLNRVPQPNRECATLQDYRDRHYTYRTDPDLQTLHQKIAWQAVWDDHEVADNTYKAGSADSNDTLQGSVGGIEFSQRKANAVRAYYEYMPIRQVETDDKLRIWRSFKVGRLFDMIMLDTRQYDRSITDLYYNTDTIREAAGSPNRSMTGDKEKSWFFSQLDSSESRGAYWRLVMQQVVFNRVNYTVATSGATDFDFDAWEGYRDERKQIVSYLKNNKINDTVILSGDSHASWVFDTTLEDYEGYDPATGEGAYGVEFAGSAVSSPSSYGAKLPDAAYVGIATNLSQSNPSLQYAEGQLRGYFELTITPQNVRAQYFGYYDQQSRNSNRTLMATFYSDKGSNHLRRPLNGGQTVAFGHIRQN